MKILLISLAVIIGTSVTIFFLGPTFLGAITSDIAPVNDFDIRLSTVPAPQRDNAYYDLIQLEGVLNLTDEEKSTINTMLEGEVEDSIFVRKIIERNTLALQYFTSASKRSLFQNPDTADPSDMKTDMVVPNLNDWRQAASLYALQALLHAKQGNKELAFQESLNIVRVGHKIINSQDFLITYVLGIAIKRKGLEVVQEIVTSADISKESLDHALTEFDQFKQNKIGHDNAFKTEYLFLSKEIDNIALGFNEEFQGISMNNFSRIDNIFYFQPNATKQLYAEWTRAHLEQTDCSTISPVIFKNHGIDNAIVAFVTKNAIGKILFDVSNGSLSIATEKRCIDLKLVEQTRGILKERAI